jgi:hypothetical protein
MVSDAQDEEFSLWVETTLDEQTRRYVPTLRLGSEQIQLTVQLAIGWARDVLDAAHAAAYDAAVFHQLHKVIDMPLELVGVVITDLRADRPGRRTLDVLPQVDLVPGVSSRTGEPFLHLRWHGEVVGQWTVADARQHALHLLETVQVADLDSAYLRMLMDHVDLDLSRASQVVHDLSKHRPPDGSDVGVGVKPKR